jgi:rhodanese-related sulfurtransferase
MKVWLVVLMLLLTVAYTYAMSGEQRISSEHAKKLIQQGATVVDVRTDIEWNLGHYPGAIHTLSSVPADKDAVIIVYCNTGQRSRAAAETLREKGYSRVYYISSSYVSLL